MFLYHSSSFSTSLTFTLFSQYSPRQSPHPGTHCNPLLKHEHNRVPQGFFEDSLHLQRINCRSFSGAVSKSIFTDFKPGSVVFHPHFKGFKQLTSYRFHCATCKQTRKHGRKLLFRLEVDFQALKIRMQLQLP